MVNESPIGETSAAQAGAGWGRYVSAVAGLGNDGDLLAGLGQAQGER